uniref:Kinesin motor domain-containing protein n=1 Tax=Oryza glumipatula TaxID=40148 RepID=A0A0D9Z5H1_9ORYZ
MAHHPESPEAFHSYDATCPISAGACTTGAHSLSLIESPEFKFLRHEEKAANSISISPNPPPNRRPNHSPTAAKKPRDLPAPAAATTCGMAQTPNPSRRSLVGPPPHPFLTPRPERRQLELRWADGGSQSSARRSGVGLTGGGGGGGGGSEMKDCEANVQVVLRCRPLSEEEQRANVQSAISCDDLKREVTVLHSLFKQADKTFTFDKVFGPKAQQRSIYDRAVKPIVKDVLEGYNCTVFAFGQTGTGKTYTMEGEMRQKASELSATAGVIPRAVRDIFDILEERKADYSMKVTFLELYNEEITDLLALEDQSRFPEDRQKRAISLMEDRKGGAVIRGLEEVVVYSASEIYNLLEHGSARRRTADTALNKQSSRSHSVFSIYIHVKETTVGNQELLKCGRLNLVDLAGSENIARSGAREGRAREAGEMNKSLLTLGRVITALVEHSVHVPYRDSKLTRLLRESLGGKAKTCIIATVSPSIHCLEETVVTLDYAYRAKSIKNKPEANQKVCKSVMLKDLYQEMERMKQGSQVYITKLSDVKAAREKNGIYIPQERFALEEAEKKTMRDKIEYLETQNKELKMNIESCKKEYLDLEEAHSRANISLKEKEFIISNLLHAEQSIVERAKDIRGALENASGDISALVDKLGRQSNTEAENKGLLFDFRSQLDHGLDLLHDTVVGCVCEQRQFLESMNEQNKIYFSAKSESTSQLERRIAKAKDIYASGVQCMNQLANTLHQRSIAHSEQMGLNILSHATRAANFLAVMVSEAEQVSNDVFKSISELKELLAFSADQQEVMLKRDLVSAQVMSKTSIDFFEDIRGHASRLIEHMEQSQAESSSQLLKFEEDFKELSVREEQAALDKIAGILAGLTAKKSTMVLDCVGQLNRKCREEQKHLKLQISNLQKVSDSGGKEAAAYAAKVESQFSEDKETRKENESILQKMLIVSTQNDAKFAAITSDMLTAVKDSHLCDSESRMRIETVFATSSDHLEMLDTKHSQGTESIRSMTAKCLERDYKANSPVRRRPGELMTNAYSLESIEQLRTPVPDLVVKFRSENNLDEVDKGKRYVDQGTRTPRSPLMPVNHYNK